MFNLNNAISDWRQEMADGGIKAPAILDELESHLREDIERRTKAGTAAEDAFNAAAREIGPVKALAKEFRKAAAGSFPEKLMITIAVLFLAFGVFLSTVTIIFCYRSLGERLMGSIALAFTLSTASVWPRIIPLLPVIAQKRKRLFIELACFFGGYGIAMLYVQLILPHFEHSLDRMIPAIGFWALFPIAVGLGLACGIERAAKRPALRIGA